MDALPTQQVLTDLLSTAVKALGKAEVQDGNQNPDHLVALLHGLKGKRQVPPLPSRLLAGSVCSGFYCCASTILL